MKLWLRFAMLRNSSVTFGRGTVFHGRPIFKFAPSARARFGSRITFTSSTRANMAGIYKPCSIYVADEAELEVGDSCGFSGVSIYCAEHIVIGDRITCGANVAIWDTDFHSLDAAERGAHGVSGARAQPIAIGNDVFIGANSLILKGVTIGDRAVIGAGSVVRRDIGPAEAWAGNPAVFVRCL
jgi:acetyltransferase-like isoleucine patch superfamily enzyme